MFFSSDPKQKYLVTNRLVLTQNQEVVLAKLYQPLISATAIGLYHALIADFDPHQALMDAKAIYLLQEEIDLSLKQLFDNLHKLEAVGLVQTLLVDSAGFKVLAFRLHKVAESSSFFATPLLASLLRSKVGRERFMSLSRKFSRQGSLNTKRLPNAKNVSATFFEVFSLPEQEAISPSEDVKRAAKENKGVIASTAQVNQGRKIDWNFLKNQFNRYHVAANEIDRNKAAIAGLMQTYGLSEQEFVDESLPSLHGSFKLNPRNLARVFSSNIHLQKSKHQVKKSVAKSKKAEKVLGSLSQRDEKLIKQANQMAPVDFLYRLKDKKGGFATGSEKRIITEFSLNYGIPNPVINMLIYACLAYNAALSKNLAESIANDWMSHNITTAAAALTYLKKRDKNKYRVQRKTNNFRQVEHGTDWKKKKADTDVSMSDEEISQIFSNFNKNHRQKD